MKTTMRRYPKCARYSLIVFALASAAAAYADNPPNPIPIPPQPDALPVPEFIGHTARPDFIHAPDIPQNPFMAPNGQSNIHDDTYMSDTYTIGGPLGTNPLVRSSFLGSQADPMADCITVTFDSAGRIVTACGGNLEIGLFLIDPNTLATLASLDLPRKAPGAGLTSGSYFFLDNQDRAVIPTETGAIWIVPEAAGPSFGTPQVFDLSSLLKGDVITSVLPDFSGRLWFVTAGGLVGTLDPTSGAVLGTQQLTGEQIANSFAVGQKGDGVYIASDHAMYRFDAAKDGLPSITWREEYDRGSQVKPGQFSQGTGTTPTLMGDEYVTITDNADPRMHVLVYRRAPTVQGGRLVCSVPVFERDKSDTENSLIATDESIIVENNFGYSSPEVTTNGGTTEPGITRIDVRRNGHGCRTVWTNQSEHIPSVVSKMSLANGLIYTYTKPPGPDNTDAWYLTAIDFRTGKTVFKQLAGTGIGYNNHYAGLYLGPDGKTAYVGVLGGLVAIRDQH